MRWERKKSVPRRQLGRPRHRWEDHIEVNRKEMGWQGMDSMSVAQVRDKWPTLINGILKFQVP
jgi:hypothetical protein